MCAVSRQLCWPSSWKRQAFSTWAATPASFLVIGRVGLDQKLKHSANFFVYAGTPNLTHDKQSCSG